VRRPVRVAGLALAFLLMLAAADRAAAAPGGITPPDYPQIGLPDAAAAHALLDQFRQAGFATGDYFLEFDLRQMPRRGDEQLYHGRLWGGRGDDGMIMRIVLRDGAGQDSRWLVQNGPQAGAWNVVAGQAQPLAGTSILDPLVGGVELTAFDLQMPYLYWPDTSVVALNRIRGRPAYAFVFRPPAAFAVIHPELAAVRAYLDTEFDRPLQIEIIGRDGGVHKTLSIVDLKKIDGQWMLKEFDVRDELTRDKTRFSLTAVALGLDFSAGLLSPGRLAEDAAVPAASRLVLVAP